MPDWILTGLLRHNALVDFDNLAREADIEWLKQMVSALRRVRSELGVPPARHVPLLVQGGGAQEVARLERFGASLQFLLRLERIDRVEGDPPPSATAVVGELRLFVPLEGVVDLDAERARLDKEIKRVEAEQLKSQDKLARFADKAPPAVVQQERQRLADWSAQRQALRSQRDRLG